MHPKKKRPSTIRPYSHLSRNIPSAPNTLKTDTIIPQSGAYDSIIIIPPNTWLALQFKLNQYAHETDANHIGLTCTKYVNGRDKLWREITLNVPFQPT
ncbi:hypothetical protein O3M35_006472 [Rhynocoris fuscipes]|uniref:Uncharacterized protein n=1 Tax=Rhynocoris fuscipes TaxID=488301 RepID=A0AAW1DDM8_9HEMI